MTEIRVYVPTTFSGLHRLAERRSLGAPPLFACAITGDLREWFARAADDELDHVAQTAAAEESLHLIAADPDETRRRVVLALDVPAVSITEEPAAGRTSVRVDAEVAIADVISIYVDAVEAVEQVAAAALAVDAADRGDDDAARTLRELGEVELLWYGTQELDDLLRG